MVLPVPDTFPDLIHRALRQWGDLQPDLAGWSRYLKISAFGATGSHPSPVILARAVREWIYEGLKALEAEDPQAAQLLTWRFLDEESVSQVAHRAHLSHSQMMHRQRMAIRALAQVMWRGELALRRQRMARIQTRLETPRPSHLFGVADRQHELLETLSDHRSRWVVVLDGIGGIGKTALADWAVRQVITAPFYADIAWISARQEVFTLWSGLNVRPARPALTLEGLLDALIAQLDLPDLRPLSPTHKLEEIRTLLKEQPYLIVVDNLETAADYQALVPHLLDMATPTRFLLTSRYSLRAYPGVYSVTLQELSWPDSLALMRHEAHERGIHLLGEASEEALSQIYRVVGGNPLALKLVVGQIGVFALPTILENLRRARGRRIEEIYHYIYWRSWQALSDAARRVLLSMPLVSGHGGTLEQIAASSDLPISQVVDAIEELVRLSLVLQVGDLQEQRYAIHQLTETFLMREVVKWQQASSDPALTPPSGARTSAGPS